MGYITEDSTQNQEPTRKFTGIWIPVEIWEAEDLPLMAKILWAEIHSLSGKGECWASNDFFSKRLQIADRTIRDNLKILKDKGLVIQTRMDGRKRFLKSLYPNNLPVCPAEIRRPERQKSATIDNSIENTPSKDGVIRYVQNQHIDSHNFSFSVGCKKKSSSLEGMETTLPKHITPRPGLKLVRSNLWLTDNDQKALEDLMGKDLYLEMLQRLEDYILSSGKKYKNHAAVLRNWYRDIPQEKKKQNIKYMSPNERF